MRDKNEGQSLAAIVAAETTEGRWRGGGTGVGVGSGGLGVFAGGASGSSTSATKRAKALAEPEAPTYDWWGVNGRAVALAAFVVLMAASFPITKELVFSDVPNGDNAAVIIEALGMVLPFAAIGTMLFAAFWISGNNNAARQEEARLAAAEARFSDELAIYQRLRYVEADHIVFDPETGQEVSAERYDVLRLIAKIVAIGNSPDGERP